MIAADQLVLPVIPATFFYRMAGVGAAGFLFSIRFRPSDPVRTGMVIYYASRTIFNGLRSIEALVMAIVFVVWVGIGPFAGSLALALHTVAALSKLYSEQVESIMAGPIEAVKATGATRIQTIIYAVVPQIVRRTSPIPCTVGISTCVCQPSLVSSAAAASASCSSRTSTC
jgi:ABC-type phosphate/phosphonate transport system permease subunit